MSFLSFPHCTVKLMSRPKYQKIKKLFFRRHLKSVLLSMERNTFVLLNYWLISDAENENFIPWIPLLGNKIQIGQTQWGTPKTKILFSFPCCVYLYTLLSWSDQDYFGGF